MLVPAARAMSLSRFRWARVRYNVVTFIAIMPLSVYGQYPLVKPKMKLFSGPPSDS